MATRNSRGQFTRKQTIVDDAEVKYEDFKSLFEEFGIVKYPLAGGLVNLATSIFGIYGGIVTATWIGVGALLMTGSAFIGFSIAIITGFILGVQAARFGAMAGKYVATGQFEADYQSAKRWLSSKFEVSKTYVARQFQTIH